MSKKPRFTGPFDKQHGKPAEATLKSAWEQDYYINWSLPSILSWKKSFLLTCQILGPVVNTLAANEKYPFLIETIQRYQFRCNSLKNSLKKIFSQFFAVFLKLGLNFKYFEKRDDPHRFCISEITDSENVVR